MAYYSKIASRWYWIDDRGRIYPQIIGGGGLGALGLSPATIPPPSSFSPAPAGSTGDSWWKDLITTSVQTIVPAVGVRIAGQPPPPPPAAFPAGTGIAVQGPGISGGIGIDSNTLLLLGAGLLIIMMMRK